MTKSRTSERLHRLTGGDRGGGLPLPLLFTAILEELLDQGGATTMRINEITENELAFKAETVYMTWPSFEDLASDVLEQMEHRKFITQEDNVWHLTPAFIPGEYVEVISGSKDHKRDGTIVWGKDEREARSRQSMTEFDAAAVIARPNPIEHNVVAELRESAGTVGHQYPVLTDRNGRLIDGHHRIQADPHWPSKMALRKDGTPVETEAEMLALIRDLDIRRPALPDETTAAIDRILGELAGTNAIKRDRVAAELKRDASRTDSEIAEIIGVDDHSVAKRRSEMVKSEIPICDYRFPRGRIAKDRQRYHSAECWCGEGEAEPSPKPKTSAASGAPQTRKMDEPALRADIRRQLSAGVRGDAINQSELCNRFNASQYVVAQAIAKETEQFLREQLPPKFASAPSAGDAQPPAPEHNPVKVPTPSPSSKPEQAPTVVGYNDMFQHLQAVANLEPDSIIADLKARGDHAMAVKLYQCVERVYDIAEQLTSGLENWDEE